MRTIRWFCCVVWITGAIPLRAADPPEPKAIVAKALQALGGEEKLSRFKAATWKAKGTFHFGQDVEFTGEWSAQPPEQLRNVLKFDNSGMIFTRVQVINGDKGWVTMRGKAQEMNAQQLAEAKEELYAGWVATVVPLTDPAFTLTVLPEARVGDRAAVGVRITHKGHRDVSLFFDKENGLPVRTLRRVHDMMSNQDVDQETLLSDYKDFGGVQHSAKSVVRRAGRDLVDLEITEFKPLEKLDERVFAKPGE
jgi:hypothetical protein